MRLIRSWPATIPENRSYVVDGIERLVMSGFDYRCLADIDDDIVLIEWDIAVGREGLELFIERAKAEPEQIRVAPYRLYRGTYKLRQSWIWVHRVRDPGTRRFVTGPEDTHCQMFGFGLIYLPRPLVLGYLKYMEGQPHARFGDSEFSRWHMRHGQRKDVPIDWDIPLVHLHYELPTVEAGPPTPPPVPRVVERRPPRQSHRRRTMEVQ